MPRLLRSIILPLAVATARPVDVLGAQQTDAGTIIGVGLGIGYVALSIGSVARLVGHSHAASIGDRVRGRSSSTTGMLAAIGPDSITIQSSAGETRLPQDEFRGLRVLEGSERKWAQGWAIGLTAGASVGAIFGALMEPPADDPGCEFICPNRGADTIIGGVVFGLTGSVVGALIGATTRSERWSRISRFVEAGGVRADPRAHTFGLEARIRF